MTEPLAFLAIARTALVIIVALVLQVAVVSHLRIFDASPDLMVLVAAAAGLAGGSERGPVVGFFSGLALDVMLTTPFGLAAMAYLLVGYGLGLMHDAMLRATWPIQAGATGVASFAGMLVFVLLGLVFGQTQFVSTQLIAVLVVVPLVNAALSAPAIRIMRWTLG